MRSGSGFDSRKRPLPRAAADSARADLAMRQRLARELARNSAQSDADSAIAELRYTEKVTDRVDQREVNGRLQRSVPNPVQPGRPATMAVSRGRRRPDPIPAPPAVPQGPPAIRQAAQPRSAAFPVIGPGASPELASEAPAITDDQPAPTAFDDAFAERPTDRTDRRPAPPLSEPPPASHQITPEPQSVESENDRVQMSSASVQVPSGFRKPGPPATLIKERNNAPQSRLSLQTEPEPLFPGISVTPVEGAQPETPPVVEYDRAAAEAAYDASGREGVYSGTTASPEHLYERSNGGSVEFRGQAVRDRAASELADENEKIFRAPSRIDTTMEPNIFGERDSVSEQRIDAILGVFENLNKNASKQRKHYESLSAWSNPLQKIEAWNMLRETRRQMKRYERTYPDIYRDFRSGRTSHHLAKRTASRQMRREEKKRAA